MIAGPPRRLGNNALEPQSLKVQMVNEHVDHADRVVLRDIVIEIFWKQNALTTALTLDEATHRDPRES